MTCTTRVEAVGLLARRGQLRIFEMTQEHDGARFELYADAAGNWTLTQVPVQRPPSMPPDPLCFLSSGQGLRFVFNRGGES